MTSVETNASALFDGAYSGNMARMQAALTAGASVNGSPELPCAPIMAAVAMNESGVVKFLIEQGADPEEPARSRLQCLSSDMHINILPGDRALHMAAKRGSYDIVRLLLDQAHADPNVPGRAGLTPLVAACALNRNDCVEVVRLLLEAGANPAFAAERGYTALHTVACNGGCVELVDMLSSRAPATLNLRASTGETPLSIACACGHEKLVSRLLSLGATHAYEDRELPLEVAVAKGHLGVVRVLVKRGMQAIGGKEGLPNALIAALRHRQAKSLLLLLMVDGYEKRSMWANVLIDGKPMIHHAAGYCCPASASVLLAAGADEKDRDSKERIPRDAIGVHLEQDELRELDRGKEVAMRRVLERGPAFRARSWAWHAGEKAGDAGGCGGGDAGFSSLPLASKGPLMGVKKLVFLRKSSRTFFGSLVGRYCLKTS